MNINYTIIGQMLFFAAFVWFCYRFIWPPLTSAMAERAAAIARSMADADKARDEAALAEQRAATLMDDARREARAILDAAQRRDADMLAQARDEARAEGERLAAAARADISREEAAARDRLRGELSALVMQGVRQVLERELDDGAHKDLLGKLARRL